MPITPAKEGGAGRGSFNAVKKIPRINPLKVARKIRVKEWLTTFYLTKEQLVS